MNRTEIAHLTDLRDRAELAALEIETLPVAQLLELDTSNLTVGQLIVFANMLDAVAVVHKASVSAAYVTPQTAERRNQDTEIGGKARFADIPKDENGAVPDEWVDANCPCDMHTRKRDPFTYKPGQYL
jgi:hypothetical protein